MRARPRRDLSPAWRLRVVDRGTELCEGNEAENCRFQTLSQLCQIHSIRPFLDAASRIAPPPYKLIMRVRKPHGLSEVRLAVNRRATTEWQYLSEPVTATPGLTQSGQTVQNFLRVGLFGASARARDHHGPHMYFPREELIPFEDVWPMRLTSRFIVPGTMEAERGPDLQMTAYRTDRPKIAIRCVCARCNNGWINQLQERGKPLIERLWSDNACTLDLKECLSLSLWAVMTSMVLQTLGDEENWLYSDFRSDADVEKSKNAAVHRYLDCSMRGAHRNLYPKPKPLDRAITRRGASGGR